MIDRQTEETASLYVLDLLSEPERRTFEGRLRKSRELRERVRELADTTSCLAHAAPLHRPPERALDAIYSRIEREPVSGVFAQLARVNRIPAAWPLAACMMLSLAVFLLVADRTGRSILDRDQPVAGAEYEDYESVLAEMRRVEQEKNQLSGVLSEKEQELARIHERYQELLRANRDARLAEDYLRRELQKLQDRAIAYQFPRDGIARLVVIELVDSATDFTQTGFVDQALQRLSEIGHQITYAHRLVPGRRPDDLPIATGPGEPAPGREVVVSSGQILRDSPAPEADALVRDPAPAREDPWQDEDLHYQPSGFSIWDETAQVGTLSVYDLPALPADTAYQLWLEDPAYDYPINVGMLPELESGTGMVYYQVDLESVTPVNVLITQEPETGSPYPSGPVILRGPGGGAPQRGTPQP